MNSAADIWERVLSLMQQTMTETTITTWFSDAEPIALDENRFILYVPTDFKREIVASRYIGDIKKALYDLFSAELEVVVLSEEEKEKYGKREPVSRFLPGTEEYTFERFVVGNSNKLAHAAALAVAEHPAENYNPLFIHGESGLGKTHLLYAIAHTIHKNHPDYKIVYIRGEDFTNELIRDIRAGKNQEFRDKYRSYSSWTTCSSSPAASPPRRRCSIPLTPFMRTKSRSSLPPTVPPRRCSGWRTG